MSLQTFRAAAAGFPLPITWQWQISDGSGAWSDLADSDVYGGTETPVLAVTVTELDQSGGEFRAVATNSFGSAISESATLTVTSGSGIV